MRPPRAFWSTACSARWPSVPRLSDPRVRYPHLRVGKSMRTRVRATVPGMASEQMRTIVELIRAQPILGGTPVEELRANMEMMATVTPPPTDVAFDPVDAAGVPAEWVTPPGVRTDA